MHRGFSLVEAIVAVSLAALAFTGLFTAYQVYIHASFESARKTQGELVAEEGLEIARYLRDQGYATTTGAMSTTTAYYFFWNGSTWQSTTTPQSLIAGRYERTARFLPVYRNGGDDIAATGTLDPDTRKVTVSVAWKENTATSTVSLITYLTDLFND